MPAIEGAVDQRLEVKPHAVPPRRQPQSRRDRDLLAMGATLEQDRGLTARRPRAADQRAHQQAAFAAQGDGGPPVAGPFVEARPLGGQPRGDRRRVALARDAVGLLRGESSAPELRAEGLRVELDIELLDQMGQAWGGPPLGSEAVLLWVVGQPSADDLLLGGRQLALPPGGGAGEQAVLAALPGRGDPTPDRAGVDAEELGNFLGGVTLQEALDGEEAAMFQFHW
jgi:hypothetical protein